jgi:LPS-assembly lipoprotein
LTSLVRLARGAALTLSLGAVLTPLAGCGFTPLYAESGVASGLSSIQVEAPRGRVGYLLREALEDDLGRDKGAAPAYRLTMAVNETRGPRGLTIADVAEYYDIGLSVHYALISTRTGKVVTSGDVSSQVSYNDSGQAYGDIAAAQDADARAAADAASRIQMKLIAWVAKPNAQERPPGG